MGVVTDSAMMLASPQFQFRVWLVPDMPPVIETWHYGLEPMDLKRRSVSEWAHDHLSELDLYDTFGHDRDVARQILGKGVIRGDYDSFGEYDEQFFCDELESLEVPREWVNSIFRNEFLEDDDT